MPVSTDTGIGIRLLAKPFDIDAVIRVVREAIASAKEHEIAAGQ